MLTNDSRTQFRCAVCTSFDIHSDHKNGWDMEKIQYVVYQKELCPKTERIHYQIYVEFKGRPYREGIRQIFNNPSIHIEPRRGTQAEAIAYCKKEETRIDGPWEIGEKKYMGSGGDRLGVVRAILSDERLTTEEKILNAKLIEQSFAQICRNRGKCFREVKVIVYWGYPGTGKTRRAHEENPVLYQPIISSDRVWFNGYAGEHVLLLDDYGGEIQINFFKKLLDGYQMPIETKGGMTFACWTKIVITSNIHPHEWYKHKVRMVDIQALLRRINEIHEFEPPDEDSYDDDI